MPFTLTKRDLEKLNTVHPDLKRVFVRAASMSPFRFRVTEGFRTVERQRKLVEQGVSWTMNSRHLTGHAVDVAPYIDHDGDGDIDAKDMYAWPLYHRLAPIIKEAAKIEGVPVEWGGDWSKRKDGPHWQLPWKKYGTPDVDAGRKPFTETEKAVTGTTGGVATFAALDKPVEAAVSAMTQQQIALSSGDIAKTIVAALIVAGTTFYVWRRTRK